MRRRRRSSTVSTQALEIAQISRMARCPSSWFGQSRLRSVTRVIEFEQRGHTGLTQEFGVGQSD
jgi:hypothetical protein